MRSHWKATTTQRTSTIIENFNRKAMHATVNKDLRKRTKGFIVNCTKSRQIVWTPAATLPPQRVAIMTFRLELAALSDVAFVVVVR